MWNPSCLLPPILHPSSKPSSVALMKSYLGLVKLKEYFRCIGIFWQFLVKKTSFSSFLNARFRRWVHSLYRNSLDRHNPPLEFPDPNDQAVIIWQHAWTQMAFIRNSLPCLKHSRFTVLTNNGGTAEVFQVFHTSYFHTYWKHNASRYVMCHIV